MACNDEPRVRIYKKKPANVNVEATASAADGLDLQAVGSILGKVQNSEHLEKMLNDPEQGLNNMDLDEDGKVDYIRVHEYGEPPVMSYSLSVDQGEGNEQEVATINVEQGADGHANVSMEGNEQIYGHGHYYNHRMSTTNFLLYSYLFRPHSIYVSPYGYGRYPGYYSPYRSVPRSSYRTRTKTITKTTTFKKSGTSSLKSKPKVSPNKGKTSSKVRASLKKPTKSQKSFQARNPSKKVGKGGFGKKGTATKPKPKSTYKPKKKSTYKPKKSSYKPRKSTPRRSSSRSRSSRRR
jgi:hypothetical protein